jgi:hypothetical protein
MSTIVGQKYDRFLLPMLPVAAWFSVLGISSLERRLGRAGRTMLGVVTAVGLTAIFVRGVSSVYAAAPTARPLVEATEFLASLPGEWVFCNPVPHCRFFGHKLPVYLPATYEELVRLADERDIEYAVLDSFDAPPSYVEILARQRIVFEAVSENRRVQVVSLEGLR